jgi:hypothetical protein
MDEARMGSTRGQNEAAAKSAPATSGNDVPDSNPGTPRTEHVATADSDAGVSDADRRTSAKRAGQGADVLWMVLPVAFQAQTEQIAQGCWVRLYSGDNFEGRYLTLAGPADIAELWSPYGTGLTNWESAIVGPAATVTTYDGEGFRARSATLRAGERYPELDDSQLGLFEDIESMRVTCLQPQGSSRDRAM